MKKFFLFSALAIFITGTALCAADCPQPAPDQCPKFREVGFDRARQGCPMMQGREQQGARKECPMRGPDFGKRAGRDGQMMRGVPMNEDEMAKFALLRLAIRDAADDYRAEPSEKNLNALRSAVDKMVAASQQFEIERCEKALARAKAAVARKDQIVTRQLKRLTAKPAPKAPMPLGPKQMPNK